MKLILDLPGGPAFPISIPGYGDNGCAGMSLRDWFASQAMASMVSKSETRDGGWDAAAAALGAYELADVMLEARELEMQTIKDAASNTRARVTHPTGSEEFANDLRDLGMPAPWRLDEDAPGELLAANSALVLRVDPSDSMPWEKASDLAAFVLCAVNTLAGFKAVAP